MTVWIAGASISQKVCPTHRQFDGDALAYSAKGPDTVKSYPVNADGRSPSHPNDSSHDQIVQNGGLNQARATSRTQPALLLQSLFQNGLRYFPNETEPYIEQTILILSLERTNWA